MSQQSSGGHIPASQSTHPLPVPPPLRRMPPSSGLSVGFPHSATMQNIPGHGAQMRSSRTWTTSSGELGLLSDTDEVEDRGAYVQEYNRLAKKHGLRILILDDFSEPQQRGQDHVAAKRGWLSRFLRSTSNSAASTTPAPLPPGSKPFHHRRSVSDLAHSIAIAGRDPSRRRIDIQVMVRLSGKSVFYLPPDYAPCSLLLPTCLRATAQYLAQNITTRGVFRIPGSVRIVNALFDYYCSLEGGAGSIASTVRCANLPMHIRCSVHDVASTFKRLLSVLPGGILGSLAIFDALLAVHSQLKGHPEFPRTKQTKVRARLIALAIGTIKSQFRRELICAVFGLLSLIGRAAELTPREDVSGRPLPTGDLMGYGALGIVFGPLLVGDLLSEYTMRLATPTSGLLVFPLSPRKLHKEKRKSRRSDIHPTNEPTVNKILVANDIAEMMIANWRDVVRQMKALGALHRRDVASLDIQPLSVRQSASSDFVIRKPPGWDRNRASEAADPIRRDGSPEPETPTLSMRRQRPGAKRSLSSNKLGRRISATALSPTVEESHTDDESPGWSTRRKPVELSDPVYTTNNLRDDRASVDRDDDRDDDEWMPVARYPVVEQSHELETEERSWEQSRQSRQSASRSPQVSPAYVPPRTSSKMPSPRMGDSVLKSSESTPTKDPSSVRLVTERDATNVGKVSSKSDVRDNEGRRGRTSQPAVTELRSSRSSSAARTQQRPSQQFLSQVSDDRGLSQPSLRSVSDFQTHEALTSLLEGLDKTMRSENIRTSTSRSQAAVPPTDEAGAFELEEEENFGNPESSSREAARSVTNVSRDSVEITPREFYAPMRVPPALANPTVHPYDVEPIQPARQETSTSASKPAGQYGQLPGGRVARSRQPEASNRHTMQDTTGGKSSARPSVSEAVSKRGAVKAMAARFETPEPPREPSPLRPKLEGQGWNVLPAQVPITPVPSNSSSRTTTQSSLGSQGQSWRSQAGQPETRRPSVVEALSESTRRVLTASVSDSVALRAAAIMEAEKKSAAASPSPEKPPMITRRRVPTPPAPMAENQQQAEDRTLRHPPSLGTMAPHREQPPVAQHLNFVRPSSSASVIGPETDDTQVLSHGSGALTARPGSTTGLHSQIRMLRRQLEAKREEVFQLKRQLEAQESSDVGTLSEQLREAKREVMTWRDRAETAERRVKVFERFTARLRGIREAAVAVEEQSDRDGEDDDGASPNSDDFHQDADDISLDQHVHVAKGRRAQQQTATEALMGSEDSGRTEDAGIVTARIRKCLHDGPIDGTSATQSGND